MSDLNAIGTALSSIEARLRKMEDSIHRNSISVNQLEFHHYTEIMLDAEKAKASNEKVSFGRESRQEVVKFDQVGQAWTDTQTRMRKIYYSKDVDSQKHGSIKMVIRDGNQNGPVLVERIIKFPSNEQFMYGGVGRYVSFTAEDVPAGEINEIYIHTEWFT